MKIKNSIIIYFLLALNIVLIGKLILTKRKLAFNNSLYEMLRKNSTNDKSNMVLTEELAAESICLNNKSIDEVMFEQSNENIKSISQLVVEPTRSLFLYYPENACISCLKKYLNIIKDSMLHNNNREFFIITDKQEINSLYKLSKEFGYEVFSTNYPIRIFKGVDKNLLFSLTGSYTITNSFFPREKNLSVVGKYIDCFLLQNNN